MPWIKNFDEAKALEKAMQAFWAHGYEATSMQNLVECTGVNRGSLYATYGGKRAFFLAALQMYDQKMRRELLAGLAARNRPREAITALFRTFMEDVAEDDSNRGCLLTNTALELSAHDPEIARIVAHAQKQTEGFFARMIIKGQKCGEIAGHVDAEGTARGLLASLLGLVVLVRSRPDTALLQGIVADALRRLD
ncbi:TetR family transcriptional regulator [Iodidimonas gelatinilytica]|uniref:TetR family transcriptional regulator n=1 Tax=Iodidimonas gelatinilytica TaxID=1236966 RepID=A0A5A7MWT5_9PROT|nr:TetR/AcrR family transcriptional regulator [Iodidimonas gelatinilytica]GER00318.1 TetR family transcriptional regulator [Iodidimonas gelatinilytica]